MEIYTIPLRGVEGAGKFIIYRPIAKMAFIGNQAMVENVLAINQDEVVPHYDEKIFKFLDQNGFFVEDPALPDFSLHDFNPTTAVLLMTNQCQLRCTYCYASAGESKHNELTFELGKAVIDLACANAEKQGYEKFDLSFHGGGEPTLAWEIFQACTNYARSKALPVNISLTSNGIWSSERRNWVMDNIDNLSLSMDGGPATQNNHRPFASGKGTFEQVMQTIKDLDERKFQYGIRMTAVAPWENLPRDVEYLCENTKCPSMQVEPAFNLHRGGHRLAPEEEALGYAAAFLEAQEIAFAARRRLSYSAARLGQVTTSFCSAPYDAFVVNANGDLVACYEVASDTHPLAELSIIGKVIGETVSVDEKARNHLHALIAERRENCHDCFCYWSCAGDCYARTFKPGENGHLQFGGRCEQNRYLLENMLLGAIAHGNGFWNGMRDQLVQDQDNYLVLNRNR